MSDLELRNKLYIKLEEQYNTFIENLIKNQLMKMIDDYSAEIAIKRDILYIFHPESEEISIDEIKVLLKEDNLLDYFYASYKIDAYEWLEDQVHLDIEEIKQDQEEDLEKNKSKKDKER